MDEAKQAVEDFKIRLLDIYFYDVTIPCEIDGKNIIVKFEDVAINSMWQQLLAKAFNLLEEPLK